MPRYKPAAPSRAIRVDDQVYAWIRSQAEPLVDTPNTVLRRIAGLPTLERNRPTGKRKK